jgi:hypothetical protein
MNKAISAVPLRTYLSHQLLFSKTLLAGKFFVIITDEVYSSAKIFFIFSPLIKQI